MTSGAAEKPSRIPLNEKDKGDKGGVRGMDEEERQGIRGEEAMGGGGEEGSGSREGGDTKRMRMKNQDQVLTASSPLLSLGTEGVVVVTCLPAWCRDYQCNHTPPSYFFPFFFLSRSKSYLFVSTTAVWSPFDK